MGSMSNAGMEYTAEGATDHAAGGGFGAVIIGDEIMRGKREDRHFAKLREVFAARGLKLDWVHYCGDDRTRLIELFRRTLAGHDVVFSFGGIGATPDDHTRQAVAAAAGVALALHPEAEREIRARMAESGQEVTASRLEMGVFPLGSTPVPNSFNRIPGFSFRDHHFFPGFPVMAHAMLEWVLDHRYAERFHRRPEAEASIVVWDGIEGAMQQLMVDIETRYPGLRIFSLPAVGEGGVRRHVELGVRGLPEQVPAAMADIRAEVTLLGYSFDEKP